MKKPTKRQQEYWDQVLHDHGLGINRGKSKLAYGWGPDSLGSETIEDNSRGIPAQTAKCGGGRRTLPVKGDK